jgi:hypothetical protein
VVLFSWWNIQTCPQYWVSLLVVALLSFGRHALAIYKNRWILGLPTAGEHMDVAIVPIIDAGISFLSLLPWIHHTEEGEGPSEAAVASLRGSCCGTGYGAIEGHRTLYCEYSGANPSLPPSQHTSYET